MFHGSHIVAFGGTGAAPSWYPPMPALRGVGSNVWVSDSQLTGGSHVFGSFPPVCPVATSVGRVDRCILVPPCPTVSGPLLGVHRPAPMQSPGTVTLDFRTEPNGIVGVFFSTELGNLQVPGIEQRVRLDTANVHGIALFVADGTGACTGTWSLPAGISHETLWFQAVALAPLLQLSPVAGGLVR